MWYENYCIPPSEILFAESTNNWTKHGTKDRAEHDVCDSVLLSVSLPHISDHAESDRTTSRGKTAQSTADHDGSEVGRESHRKLPDVDQEHRELKDRPATKLLRPGSPKLATESVSHQEDHGTATGTLRRNAKLLRNAANGIGVEGGVEVHRHLDPEDDGDDVPLLLVGEAEAELLVAVVLAELVLVMCAQLLELLAGGAIGRVCRVPGDAVVRVVFLFVVPFQLGVCMVEVGLAHDLRRLVGEVGRHGGSVRVRRALL